ncbi:hypothetical protein ITI46_26965, partial [Streptomyces oryzae]|nr:hypothetical protein [Streptomyces oryzae]
MVTLAQAQERAERWVNGDVPAYQHREVRVREFDLGFVAWAEDREGGPAADGGNLRLVIARDSGETTLWPALPVGEVIRRYEEEYGEEPAATPPPPSDKRLDLEATSFLLTPPEWLQQAADKMGIPDRRAESTAAPGASEGAGFGSEGAGVPAAPAAALGDSLGGNSTGASPWDGADTGGAGSGEAQAPPATVFAPPLMGSDEDDTPPPPGSEARTALLPEGSALPKTTVAPAIDPGPDADFGQPQPQPPHQQPQQPAQPQQAPGQPSQGGAPGVTGQGGDGTGGGGVHHAATMLADPSQGGLQMPGAPGTPGADDLSDAATSRAPRDDNPARPASRGTGPSVPPPPGAPGA